MDNFNKNFKLYDYTATDTLRPKEIDVWSSIKAKYFSEFVAEDEEGNNGPEWITATEFYYLTNTISDLVGYGVYNEEHGNLIALTEAPFQEPDFVITGMVYQYGDYLVHISESGEDTFVTLKENEYFLT